MGQSRDVGLGKDCRLFHGDAGRFGLIQVWQSSGAPIFNAVGMLQIYRADALEALVRAELSAARMCGYSFDLVPLHFGKRWQPQNSPPAFAPFLATRMSMPSPHLGQAGAVEAV